MSGWRQRRRSDACVGPQGKRRREAQGPPLPLRYALDPHPAAPQCQSANHVSHPAPVHAANSWNTSGYEQPSLGRPHARIAFAPSIVAVTSMPLRYFLPCVATRDFYQSSSCLAHRDSSIAAIFGAPSTETSPKKPCMPCMTCSIYPRNLICTPTTSSWNLQSACLTLFVLLTSYLVGGLLLLWLGNQNAFQTPLELCFAGPPG